MTGDAMDDDYVYQRLMAIATQWSLLLGWDGRSPVSIPIVRLPLYHLLELLDA